MPREPIYEGSKLTIRCVEFDDGSSPAYEFLQCLSKKNRTKVQTVIELLGEKGYVSNREHFKKVEGSDKIFEIKKHQTRLLGFFTPNQEFMIADGLRKKKDRHKKPDIERVERIRNSYFSKLKRR